jgi:hypothetical protein
MSSTWAKLSAINVNQHVEKKSGLSYLSWAWAWGLTKEQCPDASYRVINFDGRPYFLDENLGYMVQTEVTINGETLPMHLFVMDGANKAQKHVDYTYLVKSGSKTCIAASMFDINTAIMRCLVKNLAMFGLGHYIYAGEDLPHESEETRQAVIATEKATWTAKINATETIGQLRALFPIFPIHLKKELTELATTKSKTFAKQPEPA